MTPAEIRNAYANLERLRIAKRSYDYIVGSSGDIRLTYDGAYLDITKRQAMKLLEDELESLKTWLKEHEVQI